MNILPLVLSLVLMLSILTVQQVEKFKNQTIVQSEYREFLRTHERSVFNKREKSLYGDSEKTLRQLSFRYVIDKNAREKHAAAAAQLRVLIIELIKGVYGSAPFYKELQKKRPHFVEEMVAAIERAAENAPKKTIGRIQDISRLNLGDEELQEAYYRILKGTLSRDELKKLSSSPASIRDKGYPSLFVFINYNGVHSPPRIMIQRSPKEILKALFEDDATVEAIIKKRGELSAHKTPESADSFRKEFEGKRRPGIDDKLLDFSITETEKSDYD